MRYFITVSYDGSSYYGFQRLKNLPSIQSELEKALTIINKKSVLIKGSGRTDAGVHAIGQVCHFDLDVCVPANRLLNAINSLLPKNIRVIKCVTVSNDLHARFNVKSKTYKYVINLGKYDLFMENYLYNYCNELDIKSMKKASRYLIGKHNFKAFVSGYRDNYNSEIYSIKFIKNNNLLTIKFCGKSFYRYMVRNIVGALMMIGTNKLSIEEFKHMIDNDNTYSNLTVPPNGLYLERVDY